MTNHCTHQQAIALKEIGFDMELRDYYADKTLITTKDCCDWNHWGTYNLFTSAPTRSEVLQWAREKKGIDAWVRPYKDPEGIKYYGYETYQVHSYYNCFETYPEAEDALIDKIIEILKEQK